VFVDKSGRTHHFNAVCPGLTQKEFAQELWEKSEKLVDQPMSDEKATQLACDPQFLQLMKEDNTLSLNEVCSSNFLFLIC
jgi:hypothetical protein